MTDTPHRAGVKMAVHSQDEATVEAITSSAELKGFRIDSLEQGAHFGQPVAMMMLMILLTRRRRLPEAQHRVGTNPVRVLHVREGRGALGERVRHRAARRL